MQMRYSYWSRVRLAWLREDVKALMENRVALIVELFNIQILSTCVKYFWSKIIYPEWKYRAIKISLANSTNWSISIPITLPKIIYG